MNDCTTLAQPLLVILGSINLKAARTIARLSAYALQICVALSAVILCDPGVFHLVSALLSMSWITFVQISTSKIAPWTKDKCKGSGGGRKGEGIGLSWSSCMNPRYQSDSYWQFLYAKQ